MSPQRGLERAKRRFDPIQLLNKSSNKRGPWSPAEDQQLREQVLEKGAGKWVAIAEVLKSRTPKQCRERWHQNLDPKLNHDPITAEEGERIEELVKSKGKRWADIARMLNNRSDNAVKNWWNGGENRRKRDQARADQANQPPQYSPFPAHFDRGVPFHYPTHVPRPSLDDRAESCNLPPLRNFGPRGPPAPLNIAMANLATSPTEISPIPSLTTDASSPRYGVHSHRPSMNLPTPVFSNTPMNRTHSAESWRTQHSPVERNLTRTTYPDRTHIRHETVYDEKHLPGLEHLNRGGIYRPEPSHQPSVSLPGINNLTNCDHRAFLHYHQHMYQQPLSQHEPRQSPEVQADEGRRRMSLGNILH